MQNKKQQQKKRRRISQETENQKLNLRLLEDVKNLSLSKLQKEVNKTKAGPITYYSSSKKKKRISKNTAYKRGRNFEYRVQNHFRKLGYYVKRSYASKGAEDLIAIKGVELSNGHTAKTLSEVFVIQCKNLKVEKKLKREDAIRLIALAKQCGGTPLLASNQNHRLNITEVLE